MSDQPSGSPFTGPVGGRVVVITGAARGLGRDYAQYFASDGAKVVIADITEPTSAVAQVVESGGECIGVAVDITDPASVAAMVDATVAAFGRLDLLINNAGLWRLGRGLLDLDEASWQSAWRVNVDGTLNTFRAVVPTMREQGFGRIINVSSIAAVSGITAYGLTKNTVNQMTRGMAQEVGEFGITVNCVAPGISTFQGAKGAIPNMEELVASCMVKRLGTTWDLYAAMRYFCSTDASWVTGQTLYVDGGATSMSN